MTTAETSTSGNDTIRTTKSVKEKGEMLKRCFINMIKCYRTCINTKKKQDVQSV